VGGFISGWTEIWHFKILINHRPWRAPASRRLPCCWFHNVNAVSLTHGHQTRPPQNIISLYGLQLVFKSVRRRRRHIRCNLTWWFLSHIVSVWKKTIKHCWILQFLLENGKNALFHIKSPVKNFHGRDKGGDITPCPLLNTLLFVHTWRVIFCVPFVSSMVFVMPVYMKTQ